MRARRLPVDRTLRGRTNADARCDSVAQQDQVSLIVVSARALDEISPLLSSLRGAQKHQRSCRPPAVRAHV